MVEPYINAMTATADDYCGDGFSVQMEVALTTTAEAVACWASVLPGLGLGLVRFSSRHPITALCECKG
jgi:hypothetical protein